jgi:hypothetical protein
MGLLLRFFNMKKFISLFNIGPKNSPRVIPEITLKVLKKEYGGKNFAAPNPDITQSIYDSEGNAVGSTVYTISPLNDRIYIFEVEIEPVFRRRGFGLALLASLSRTYGFPITVVHPISPALLFWEAARKELADNVRMTQSISAGDMDAEKTRWGHLQPQIYQLEKEITERFLRGEPYEQAVGRGLGE